MITSSPCCQFTGVATLCFGGQLDRIDDAQHLVEVAARRHRIDENELDLLVRPDDEHVPHGLIVGWRAPCDGSPDAWPAAFRRASQIVQIRVADHRIVRRRALGLLMSSAHLVWLSTGSTLRPMILTLRLSNSGLILAM